MGNEVSTTPAKYGRPAYHVKPVSCKKQDTDFTLNHSTTKLRRSNETNLSNTLNKSVPIAYQIASMSSMVVSIEGNIGSGKSTILRILKHNPEFKAIQQKLMRPVILIDEPVKEWDTIRDKEGTILEKFYGDPKKYAFSFQIMAYATRFQAIQTAIQQNPNSIIITERCLETDKHVFARMLYESGDISPIDYEIYKRCYDAFSTIVTDKHIYINTRPMVCYQRVQKRSRQGEDCIEFSYLSECGEVHDEWLNSKENVHTIDGNIEFEHDSNEIKHILTEIVRILNPNIDNQYLEEIIEDVYRASQPITTEEMKFMTIHSCS